MSAPAIDHRIVEALVQTWLPHAKGRRLLLVYGRYTDSAGSFVVSTDRTANPVRRRVHVSDQHSVLGIVEAWEEHQQAHEADDDLLVVTTSVDDSQLGWDIRGYAIGRSTRTVDKVRIVAQRFGAVDVDPRIRQEPWLVDALLDAEPADGWPRNGSVLTRDSAIRALIGARLGQDTIGEGSLDVSALLEFSRDPAGPAYFAELPAAERDGLTRWLADTVGPAAVVPLRLAVQGRAADAIPLGVVGTAATNPDAALAVGALLPGTQAEELRAFTDAVAAVLERWVSEAETSRHGDAARHRVLDVVRRADELATQAQVTEALAGNPFLPSAFTVRLRELAAALTAKPDPTSLAEAERALDRVREHALARLEPRRREAAEMAVRLQRWLARPQPELTSVAEAVTGHLSEWAWVDRALNTLWEGDPFGDPVVGQAYRTVCEAVRARRTALDEDFATRLATWVKHADSTDTGGCLLVEQVLGEVAAPLRGKLAPLIVVLDGMSGAVAVELGQRLAGRAWTEVSPVAGRRAAAVAAIPSVTRASRASLLTGAITAGDQAAEKDGFKALWKRHGDPKAELFHRGDIAGDAGHRLSDPLLAALSESGSVVGVVLNTIDYALDHGQEGHRTGWAPEDITYLPELLDAARSYGRPVVLVSDHGHVLDRATEDRVDAGGVESARWRTGTPDDGEMALTGPRVVYGEGSVVVPWREDIRYTTRKAGYHGGASLAELTVPVLVLLPAPARAPSGWHVLEPEQLTPKWWTRQTAATPAAEPKPRARKPSKPSDAVPLFTVESKAESLGNRVVASGTYDAQRAFVPKAPNKQVVAAVIDALVAADNRLPLSTAAELAGKAGRRPEFFATMLERLLNVDGYPVLSKVDGDRRLKLDVETLRMQFGVREP
ncbi:hypothetical protein FHU38_005063 [Saccharomonospora amisosensis]|uniref:PglZ domain-containing protein n=1 Tax=Saccharomonospora amisosensis TaxID=1128677 RepID=A0A7X5UVN3_9PSEU|nr:BREX-2 system phosphatase PglZ [Saccharomonospora amisosensis]NIJ14662.1 hypothetical protein [Saccharomonospora amisosensis]